MLPADLECLSKKGFLSFRPHPELSTVALSKPRANCSQKSLSCMIEPNGRDKF